MVWLRGPCVRPRVLAILIAGALVAASLAGPLDEQASPEPPAALDSTETSRLLEGVPQNGTVLGRPDAPVTLVEYGDLQCPCSALDARGAPVLVDEYVRPGSCGSSSEEWPSSGQSRRQGSAALAAEQDKLWHVVDLLYHNQGHENSGWLNDETLRLVGSSVPGLDVERMLDRRGRCPRRSRSPRFSAAAAGITGTPSFQVGPTGRRLTRVPISSLDAGALRPAIVAAVR